VNLFEFAEPRSLDEAIALLDTDDPTVRPFSGGTALMLMMKAGVFEPSKLVSLRRIEDRHAAISGAADGGLKLGAMATLSAVEHSPYVAKLAPLLPTIMKRLSNVRVRNVARLGGNLAHGDPHMDLPPVLCALRADIIARGASGERRIAVEDLFSGYYETVLARSELITEIDIPSQRGWASHYSKVTTRTHDDWPALGVAVAVKTHEGVISDCRVVVSAATEKLIRLSEAEAALRGQSADHDAFVRAAEAAATEAETIDDVRGSAAYKTDLIRVYVRRSLEAAITAGAMA
jgi:carbon-monoxide dehydrogenase medium subunit